MEKISMSKDRFIRCLKEAFTAGQDLTYQDLAEYEGVYDGETLPYEDFEQWFNQSEETMGDSLEESIKKSQL